jgi:hypothetical protein
MATAVTAPTRLRQGQTSRILLPLAVPFLILAGIAVYAALTPLSKTNLPPPGARGSLVWGDAIFANERELKAWMRQHGGSYEAWVKSHPAAFRLVKPQPKHHAVLAKAHKKQKTTTKVAAGQPVRRVSSASVTTRSRGGGIWFVVGLGLLLGALAAVPQRVLFRAGIPLGSRERELRVAAIGSGAALLLGVIAATLLG